MLVTLTGTYWPGNPNKRGPFEGKSYHVPPGTVLVEYVGDQSPFDDPHVALRIQLGHYSAEQIEVMRTMARRAVKPWANLERVIRKGQGLGEMKRFSRTYKWGHGKASKPMAAPGEPGSWFQLMTARDADILKASEAGYQFRIHPDEPPLLLLPATDIRLVQKDDVRNYGELRRYKW